jgi:hypothetical protein
MEHSLFHFGPSLLMILIIAWIAWRSGQLAQSRRAAALPLLVGGIAPDDAPGPRRFPVVVLVLAVLMGIGVGVPIATAYVATHIADPGAAVTTQEKGH